MNIDAMDHAGLNIINLERSAAWYQDVLGFDVVHKWTHTWLVARDSMRLGLFERPEAQPVDDLDNKIAITHIAYHTDPLGLLDVQTSLMERAIDFQLVACRAQHSAGFFAPQECVTPAQFSPFDPCLRPSCDRFCLGLVNSCAMKAASPIPVPWEKSANDSATFIVVPNAATPLRQDIGAS